MRFRGTIDHWDPAFLEPLAAERVVMVFVNAGVNASTGTTPATIAGMAGGLLEFADALGLACVDLLGWSMGGAVVQAAALERPPLVRRLISAGSGPGGVPGTPPTDAEVLRIAARPVNDDEDFLTLFFPPTGAARAAGIASLRRIDRRLLCTRAGVSAAAWGAQLQAIAKWSAGEASAWERLGELTLPVLAANGVHDVMAPADSTAAMAGRLPDGAVLLYSDAGHGFLFQHPRAFALQVNAFLSA
jgi:pimeloyl-ACP methyl ester carboxylesterase